MSSPVGQLYTRVFVQILDSSIAEDYTLRHVFEDFLKLVDWKTGCVDITREAMARRLNIPLKILNEKITALESPDPASRDPDNDGRRLERLDDHRDWGWRVLNWQKYDTMRNRADVSERVARHREKERIAAGLPPITRPKNPTLDEIKLQCAKIGLPDSEAEKFFNYYQANGWRVGKNPMKSWTHALANWKLNFKNYGKTGQKPNPRNNGVVTDPDKQSTEVVELLRRRQAGAEALPK